MLTDFAIRELAKIVCGDVDYMPYLAGPNLVELFNRYGFRDTYGQVFPYRWVYTEEKLLEFNGTSKIVKLIKEIVHPRRFVTFEGFPAYHQ